MAEIMSALLDYKLPRMRITNTEFTAGDRRNQVDPLLCAVYMKSASIYNEIDCGLITAGFGRNYSNEVINFIQENDLLQPIKEIASKIKAHFACTHLSLEMQRYDSFYLELWVECDMTRSEIVDAYLDFLHDYWTAKSNVIKDLIIVSVIPE